MCGDCFTKCQYLQLDKDTAVQEMKNLMDGKDSFVLSDCVTCYACNEYCKPEANPFDLIATLQEERNSLGTMENARKMMENQYQPYESSKEVEIQEPFMNACAFIKTHAETFKSKLFEGVDVLGGRNFFCNLLYFHTGQYSLVEKRAREIVSNIAKLGVKEVICFHDECYAFYTRYVPEYGIDLPFKPIHIFEYMVDYFKKHKDDIKPLNLKVAYQRSCSTRLTPDKDKYLDELLEILGVTRVKREYDGENALCCQAPGLQLAGAVDRDLIPREKVKERKKAAKQRQKDNIEDAVNAGANAMLFVCPMCEDTLGKKAKRAGLLPVFITDLGRMALGEIEPQMPE